MIFIHFSIFVPDVCTSSKKCAKCLQEEWSTFEPMFVSGTDFSSPLKSRMQISDVCCSDDWCSWNIGFNESGTTREKVSQLCSIERRLNHMSEEESTTNVLEVLSDFDICFGVALDDTENMTGEGIMDPDSNKDSFHEKYFTSDGDSESDSDYSEPESEEESDCDWSDEDSDSDEDFSIVFDEGCCHNKANETVIKQSNLVMNIQAVNGAVYFEDVPEFCLDDIFDSCKSCCKEHKCKENLNEGSINDILLNNVHEFVICKYCGENQQLQMEINNLPPNYGIVKPKPKKKHVRFAQDEKLVTVHPMVTWAHAYQQSRKGHWEQFVLDRCHFQRRIKACEEMLSAVINKKYQQFLESM